MKEECNAREQAGRHSGAVEPDLQTVDEAQLWALLKVGDAAARDRLVKLHLPHARRVAATYYRRRLHDEIEFDDYLQLAVLGMMESLDRFDPALGVRFRTFAGRRMHGVILDGLEQMTEKQQQIAARRRAQQDRLASLVQRSSPEDATVAAPGRIPPQTDALFRYLAEVGVGLALSFLLDGTGLLQQDEAETAMPAAPDTTYYRRTELRQLREKLLVHLDDLKPQARQVIRSHYLQAMPFEAIAQAMGLTKGRVSQIHREALLWLRNELKVERSSDLVC